jgi:hypothetical protein
LDLIDVRCDVHHMTWSPSPERLSDLAFRIAEHGTASAGTELARVVEAAMCRGLAPGAVDALLDPASHEVVRQRAFGLVAAALTSDARRSSAVEQRLDPLGDLGEDLHVAVGAHR